MIGQGPATGCRSRPCRPRHFTPRLQCECPLHYSCCHCSSSSPSAQHSSLRSTPPPLRQRRTAPRPASAGTGWSPRSSIKPPPDAARPGPPQLRQETPPRCAASRKRRRRYFFAYTGGVMPDQRVASLVRGRARSGCSDCSTASRKESASHNEALGDREGLDKLAASWCHERDETQRGQISRNHNSRAWRSKYDLSDMSRNSGAHHKTPYCIRCLGRRMGQLPQRINSCKSLSRPLRP